MNEEVKISNQQKSGKNIGLWNNEVLEIKPCGLGSRIRDMEAERYY